MHGFMSIIAVMITCWYLSYYWKACARNAYYTESR